MWVDAQDITCAPEHGSARGCHVQALCLNVAGNGVATAYWPAHACMCMGSASACTCGLCLGATGLLLYAFRFAGNSL